LIKSFSLILRPQRGLILDVSLLWALSAHLPEIWGEVKETMERIRRILAQYPDKVEAMVRGYIRAKADSTSKFASGSRYN
jgi:hypothetical protein